MEMNRITKERDERIQSLTEERDQLKYRLQVWDDTHAEAMIATEARAELLATALREIKTLFDDDNRIAEELPSEMYRLAEAALSASTLNTTASNTRKETAGNDDDDDGA
jgi:hypothetical protein